jgi:hypothetical protein
MYRAVLAGLALAALLPAALHAQRMTALTDVWDNPRMRITPWLSSAPRLTRTETRVTSFGPDSDVTQAYFAEVELGTGYGAGFNAEYRFLQQFTGFIGSGFVTRGQTVDYSDLDGFYRAEQGSNFIMTRAGIGMRLREQDRDLQLRQLDASAFIGPTWILELPRHDAIRGPARRQHLFGVHFGIDGEVPLANRRLAVHAALEDNVVWWRQAELGRRADAVFAAWGQDATTTVSTGASHLVMFRLGLTVRVQ